MYCTNPAENVASASAVLEVDDRLPHGRYAAPRAPLPYEPAFTGTPKAWPPETLYTRSAARNETYISDYRTLPASNTFGKPAHAKTLKTTLAEHGQSPPRHPLPSAALCSKTAPLVSASADPGVQSFAHTATARLGGHHHGGGGGGASALSALQDTLLECGALRDVGGIAAKKTAATLARGYQAQKEFLLDHGRRLHSGSHMDADHRKSKAAHAGTGTGTGTGTTGKHRTSTSGQGLMSGSTSIDEELNGGSRRYLLESVSTLGPTGTSALLEPAPMVPPAAAAVAAKEAATAAAAASMGQKVRLTSIRKKDPVGIYNPEVDVKPAPYLIRLKEEYTKGDWQYAVTEVVTHRPQVKFLPSYGLDVRHDFTPKPRKGEKYRGESQRHRPSMSANPRPRSRGAAPDAPDAPSPGPGPGPGPATAPPSAVLDARRQAHPLAAASASTTTTEAYLRQPSLVVKPKKNAAAAGGSSGAGGAASYHEAVLDHLQVHTHEYGGLYRNPYRDPSYGPPEERLVPAVGPHTGFTARHMSQGHLVLAAGRVASVVRSDEAPVKRTQKHVPATTYRKLSSHVRPLGSLSMVVNADDANDHTFQATRVPSKSEVQASLADAAKRTLVQYDMRIVETGALLKALRDRRHPTPGIAAIEDLHATFVAATAVNPDPWNLTREQMMTIFAAKLPWYPAAAASRLISSYDPGRSGVVRYVRLSASLIICQRPAMTDLIALQEKIRALRAGGRYEDLYESTAQEGSAEATIESFAGVLYVMKIIFNMYEQCEGALENSINAAAVPALVTSQREAKAAEKRRKTEAANAAARAVSAAAAPAAAAAAGGVTGGAAAALAVVDPHPSHIVVPASRHQLVTKCTCQLCAPRPPPAPPASTRGLRAGNGPTVDADEHIKDAFFQYQKKEPHRGSGMRMEHIAEACAIGACDMTDELRMRALAAGFLQTLYLASQRQLGTHAATAANYYDGVRKEERERRMDLIHGLRETREELPAARLLAFAALRSVKHLPRVPQELFFTCIPDNMNLLEEFHRQMGRFRDLTAPFTDTHGSVCYDKALLLAPAPGHTKALFGTRTNRNDPDYLRKLARIV